MKKHGRGRDRTGTAGGSRVRWNEVFGIESFRQLYSAVRTTIRGNDLIPPTRMDLTSIRIFRPSVSFATWLRLQSRWKAAPVYNYFNHDATSLHEGYSVRVTRVRDTLGGGWTYDSHRGVDLAVPVGTPVVTPAPGTVLAVENRLERGGLKVVVDHGEGLVTTLNHLSRVLVTPGQALGRGQVVGLSGASGLEFLFFFPFVSPHLHINFLFNGVLVDPFPHPGEEVSLWHGGMFPVPFPGGETPANGGPDASPEQAPGSTRGTEWERGLLLENVRRLRDERARARLLAVEDNRELAAAIVLLRIFRTPLFEELPPLYSREYPRRSRLDLPFRKEDYLGILHRWGHPLPLSLSPLLYNVP